MWQYNIGLRFCLFFPTALTRTRAIGYSSGCLRVQWNSFMYTVHPDWNGLASLFPKALLKCIVMHIYAGGVMQYMHITCMGQINLSPALLCVWNNWLSLLPGEPQNFLLCLPVFGYSWLTSSAPLVLSASSPHSSIQKHPVLEVMWDTVFVGSKCAHKCRWLKTGRRETTWMMDR